MGIKALRKALKKSRADEFDNGTVIRWTSAERYTYAAVKTPAGWFTSSRAGNFFVPQVLEFADLIEILSRAETSNVEVAVEWESV